MPAELVFLKICTNVIDSLVRAMCRSKTNVTRLKQLLENCCFTKSMYPTIGELEDVPGQALQYKSGREAMSKDPAQLNLMLEKVKSYSQASNYSIYCIACNINKHAFPAKPASRLTQICFGP